MVQSTVPWKYLGLSVSAQSPVPHRKETALGVHFGDSLEIGLLIFTTLTRML